VDARSKRDAPIAPARVKATPDAITVTTVIEAT